MFAELDPINIVAIESTHIRLDWFCSATKQQPVAKEVRILLGRVVFYSKVIIASLQNQRCVTWKDLRNSYFLCFENPKLNFSVMSYHEIECSKIMFYLNNVRKCRIN